MTATVPAPTPTTSDPDGAVSLEALRAILGERSARPARPSAFAVVRAFGWRAMRKIRHVPEQLFDVTIFPVMFTLLFTFLFGGALAGSVKEYVQFLIPGILVQTILMITMYTGMGVNQDIEKGVFDRFRSLSIWQPGSLVGMLVADAARYTIASTVLIVLGLLLGFRPDGGVIGVLGAIAILIVFAFALSWVWTLVGLTVKSYTAVLNFSMMILFPLTFVSNVFVDPSTMPNWLQKVVDLNPVTHLSDVSRTFMNGNFDGPELLLVLIEAAVIIAIFAPLTMIRYNKER